jgi:hypothetical protein
MQKMHPGQYEKFAFRPGCKFCQQASLQILHSGGQRAKTAFLESANFARLVSAEFARDSINYLINYF